MRACILLFNFQDRDRLMKLRRTLMPLKLNVKMIGKADYLKPVGALAGIKDMQYKEEAYTGPELSGEMLVMAGLTEAGIDAVLQAIRKSGAGPVPYKAVLTETNRYWNVIELFDELKKEHAAMSGEKNT